MDENNEPISNTTSDKNNNKQFSNMIVDSTVENSMTEKSDFDLLSTPSQLTSAFINKEYSPSSASISVEHRYQLVGNINVVKQLYKFS